jgi:hypothetical protein
LRWDWIGSILEGMARQTLLLLLLLLPGLLLPPGLVLAVCPCQAMAAIAGACCASSEAVATATCCAERQPTCCASPSSPRPGDPQPASGGDAPTHRAKPCGCELRLPEAEDQAQAADATAFAVPALLVCTTPPWLQPPTPRRAPTLAAQVRPPPPDARRSLPLLL